MSNLQEIQAKLLSSNLTNEERIELEKLEKELKGKGHQVVQSKFDGSSIIARPRNSEIKGFAYSAATSNVATLSQAEAISKLFLEIGVPKDKVAEAAWDLARHCADCGSSESADLIEFCSVAPAVSRAELGACVKSVTTLHRFCMLFAKIVWGIMISSGIPPSNWLKKDFKEETKFAAFDFFEGVCSNASIEPVGGLIRKPSNAEIVAAATAKRITILRHLKLKGNSATSHVEVTGGKAGGVAKLMLKDVDES